MVLELFSLYEVAIRAVDLVLATARRAASTMEVAHGLDGPKFYHRTAMFNLNESAEMNMDLHNAAEKSGVSLDENILDGPRDDTSTEFKTWSQDTSKE